MDGSNTNDKSHEVLSDMAQQDVEQPGETPSDDLVSGGSIPEKPDEKTAPARS